MSGACVIPYRYINFLFYILLESILFLVKTGDPKYRIPGLNPLKITKIEVADRGLNITMNNILVWGLKDVDFIAAR